MVFTNISVRSWPSVLLVEETGVPGEIHLPVASHRQTLSNNVVWNTLRHVCKILTIMTNGVTNFQQIFHHFDGM
jgi:hypothetical protein